MSTEENNKKSSALSRWWNRNKQANATKHNTGKTARTLGFFILFATLPYLIQAHGMEKYRVLMPTRIALALNLQPPAPSVVPTQDDALEYPVTDDATADNGSDNSSTVNPSLIQPVSNNKSIKVEVKPGQIEDPSGHALDHFFSALQQTANGKGIVRISHYGDSPITSDGITLTIRRNLQQEYGDGGHGFVLIDKPWGWYGHDNVVISASRGWQSYPMAIAHGDRIFGFGGASFSTKTAGVTATVETMDKGELGAQVTAFEIYYLSQPNGGQFDVLIDGEMKTRVSTVAATKISSFQRVEVEQGPHKLMVRTVGNGEVRLFGVTLENGTKGVQYDSLGVNGAFVGLLANFIDKDQWIEQLKHRNPDLVILGYGTNESQFEKLPMKQYEKDTIEAISRIRTALPNASIMLLGPMDRGMHGPGGEIVTRPMIPKLVNYQRRLAAEMGCAFFDTYTAMGGEGTVAQWYTQRPKLMGGDFTHPTAQGSEIVGTLIHKALTDAFQQYKIENSKLSKK